jgi:hypothetical protein
MVKSHRIDAEIGEYVANTKGGRSARGCGYALLRCAMLQERDEKLEAEAAAFFALAKGKRRKIRLEFQEAARRRFDRDSMPQFPAHSRRGEVYLVSLGTRATAGCDSLRRRLEPARSVGLSATRVNTSEKTLLEYPALGR